MRAYERLCFDHASLSGRASIDQLRSAFAVFQSQSATLTNGILDKRLLARATHTNASVLMTATIPLPLEELQYTFSFFKEIVIIE